LFIPRAIGGGCDFKKEGGERGEGSDVPSLACCLIAFIIQTHSPRSARGIGKAEKEGTFKKGKGRGRQTPIRRNEMLALAEFVFLVVLEVQSESRGKSKKFRKEGG